MRLNRALVLGTSVLVLVGACATGGGEKPTIRIGSDGFYESRLMAEIYAQVLENDGFTAERSLGLGPRKVSSAALEGGQIDLKPEYIGSGLGYYDPAQPTGDAATNAASLAAILATKGGGISVLGYTPGQDTNAFVVRQDTAQEFNLTRMSDLAAVQGQLTWGLPPECETNPLCGGALAASYGISFPPQNLKALAACDAPIAEALRGGAVDVAQLCSTQPAIAQFGFVVLEDDKKTQPAENIAPIVRDDYLAKVDQASFRELLDAASARMTTDELTRLGVAVAVNNRDVAEVATEWLKAQGLVE